MPMSQKDIEELVQLLEKEGYTGAMRLIINDLIPVAKKHHISLFESINKYMEGGLEDEEDDFHKLRRAYWKISRKKLAKLNITTRY